jgi:hypothetical protein
MRPLHLRTVPRIHRGPLEAALARFVGTEASKHVIRLRMERERKASPQTVREDGDFVCSDALNHHASIIRLDAARPRRITRSARTAVYSITADIDRPAREASIARTGRQRRNRVERRHLIDGKGSIERRFPNLLQICRGLTMSNPRSSTTSHATGRAPGSDPGAATAEALRASSAKSTSSPPHSACTRARARFEASSRRSAALCDLPHATVAAASSSRTALARRRSPRCALAAVRSSSFFFFKMFFRAESLRRVQYTICADKHCATCPRADRRGGVSSRCPGETPIVPIIGEQTGRRYPDGDMLLAEGVVFVTGFGFPVVAPGRSARALQANLPAHIRMDDLDEAIAGPIVKGGEGG